MKKKEFKGLWQNKEYVAFDAGFSHGYTLGVASVLSIFKEAADKKLGHWIWDKEPQSKTACWQRFKSKKKDDPKPL